MAALARELIDDQLAVLDCREVGAEGDPPDEVGLLLLGELAARHGLAGRVGDVALAALEARVVELDAHDLEARAGQDLRDARTHGAQADHTDLAERHDISRSSDECCQQVTHE